MDMFKWDAKEDESVVSPRFWIFWAVAVPVTLVMLAGWSAWLVMHRRREDARRRRRHPSRYIPRRGQGPGRRRTGAGLEAVLTGEPVKTSGAERPWARWMAGISIRRRRREKVGDEEGKRAEPGEAMEGVTRGAAVPEGNAGATGAGAGILRKQTSPLGPRRG